MLTLEELPEPRRRRFLPNYTFLGESYAEITRRRAGLSSIAKIKEEVCTMQQQYCPIDGRGKVVSTLPLPPALLAKVDEVTAWIRRWANYSNDEVDELVLSQIEKHNLFVVTDLLEHLVIDRPWLQQILDRLVARRLAYYTERYCPGSDRPQFLIKSCRTRIPEVVDDLVYKPSPTVYDMGDPVPFKKNDSRRYTAARG